MMSPAVHLQDLKPIVVTIGVTPLALVFAYMDSTARHKFNGTLHASNMLIIFSQWIKSKTFQKSSKHSTAGKLFFSWSLALCSSSRLSQYAFISKTWLALFTLSQTSTRSECLVSWLIIITKISL